MTHVRNVTVINVGDSGANIIVDHRFAVLVDRDRVPDILWLIQMAIDNPGDEPAWNRMRALAQ